MDNEGHKWKYPSSERNNGVESRKEKPSLGLIIGGIIGLSGVAIMAIATPFVMPALRRHCLPYVPATDNQLSNLTNAFKRHAKKGDSFLDVGSGDGRICRLSAKLKLFSQVHGVELNYILVLFSRALALKSGQFSYIKYYHRNLWNFPIHRYDTICIFGVESMMESFTRYLRDSNTKPQIVFACRYPLKELNQIDEIGDGIDTVWVYKMAKS